MDHPGQLIRHILAAGLLDKPQDAGKHHHNGNDGHRPVILLPRCSQDNICKHRNPRQYSQHQGKGIDKGLSQPLPYSMPAAAGKDIFSVLLPGGFCPFFSQPVPGCAVSFQQHIFIMGGRPVKPLTDFMISYRLCPAVLGDNCLLIHLLHGSVPPEFTNLQGFSLTLTEWEGYRAQIFSAKEIIRQINQILIREQKECRKFRSLLCVYLIRYRFPQAYTSVRQSCAAVSRIHSVHLSFIKMVSAFIRRFL